MMNSGSDEIQKTGIAIFASGAGTNAENCIRYFQGHPSIEIKLIVSNRKGAGVLEKARKYGIPSIVINKSIWENPGQFALKLRNHGVDFILLAGYLALLPGEFISDFDRPIVNIHPALLPKFGGRGMYGLNVHQQVINSKESETGFTVHEVNAEYDSGKILFQKRIKIENDDSPESIEKKVRELEYYYLPRVIEGLILNRINEV